MAKTARKKSTQRKSAPRTSPSGSENALALLQSDHREVEELFSKFEKADDEGELEAIAGRICKLLRLHAHLEEDMFYPAAKAALREEEDEIELVSEAEIEHQSARDLIGRIEAMRPGDEHFRATVKVLGEYVRHHVEEEEKQMFPHLKQADLDLEKVGAQMAERKRQMRQQLAIGGA